MRSNSQGAIMIGPRLSDAAQVDDLTGDVVAAWIDEKIAHVGAVEVRAQALDGELLTTASILSWGTPLIMSVMIGVAPKELQVMPHCPSSKAKMRVKVTTALLDAALNRSHPPARSVRRSW